MFSTEVTSVTAVHHIRRLRGGAQSHLLAANDGEFYVVKFKNNPQHRRILANEMLASLLAQRVGLPVACPALIDVPDALIGTTPELSIQHATSTIRCEGGVQFGSKHVCKPQSGHCLDVVPKTIASEIENLHCFAGMLVLDKWMCNADSRQAVFYKTSLDIRYRVAFIDHGYCFDAGEWKFRNAPSLGTHPSLWVYLNVTGWESFEPWLSAVLDLRECDIWACADSIPEEWYGRRGQLVELLEKLSHRRRHLFDLILSFRNSSFNPFPNWH